MSAVSNTLKGHSPARVLMHRWLSDRLVDAPATLDLGCGSQSYADLLPRRVVGVDLEGAGAVRADLEKPLPFSAQSFDQVLMLNVLELIYDEEGLIDEVFRVLRPGGSLLLWNPFLIPVHHEPHDYRRMTERLLRRRLLEAGFDIEETASHGGLGLVIATFVAHLLAPVPVLPPLSHLTGFVLQGIVDRVKPSNASTWPLSVSAVARRPSVEV